MLETEAARESGASVFEFRDYREFLGAWLRSKKSANPRYSGALFARRAGLTSHTLLGMVIRGERNLGYGSIRGFCRALGLRGREQTYFERLVLFNQARASDDKAYHFEHLLQASQGEGKTLLTRVRDHAKFLSHWYVVAIREMAALDDFRDDGEWIARRLKRKISKKQAEQALELLLKLGLLERDAPSGRIKIVDPAIDIDPGSVDFAIRNYHKEYLDRAKEAVDGESNEERELSSLTLAVSESDLPLLRQRIKEFRKQLNTDFPASEGPRTQVVAVNTQAIILTEKGETDEKPRE